MQKARIELIQGVEGKSISINDYRVCGPKPWGGGTTEKVWMVDEADIKFALSGQTAKDKRK